MRIGRLVLLLAVLSATGGCAPASGAVSPTATADHRAPPSLAPTVSSPNPVRTPTSEPVRSAQYTFPGKLLRLNDLYFLDQDNGWAVGDVTKSSEETRIVSCCQPAIFHTLDGGQSWIEIKPPLALGSLESITFADPLHGYIAGIDLSGIERALILQSTDAGRTWSRADVPNIDGQLNDIIYAGAGVVWSVGQDIGNSTTLMLRKSDGADWARQDNPPSAGAELRSIAFPTGNVGYAVGSSGGHDSPDPYILKTIDGGETWNELGPPYVAGRLLDVLFIDELTGFAVGHNGDLGAFIKTGDGGKTWAVDTLGGSEITLEWLFESPGGVIVVGNDCYLKNGDSLCNGKAWISRNASDNWQQLISMDRETITAAHWLESDSSLRFSTNFALPVIGNLPHDLFQRTSYYEYSLQETR
jgi:photosystem II stability/assembly factor-like uncharacterized protein